MALDAERRQAVLERDEKEQAREDAVAERDRAERERRRADEEAAVARAVNEFIERDLLGPVGAGGSAAGDTARPDPNVTARALLDRAAGSIGKRFQDRPAVEAALRQVIANSYSALGLWELSLPHWRRAAELKAVLLGPAGRDALTSRLVLAEQTAAAGRKGEAVRILDEIDAVVTPQFEALANEAPALIERLGFCYQRWGRAGDANRLLTRLLDATTVPERLDTWRGIDDALHATQLMRAVGRVEAADRTFDRARGAALRLAGEDSPEAVEVLFRVGDDLRGRDRPGDAIEYYERARDLYRRKHGPDRPLKNQFINMGYAYLEAGRPAEAAEVFEEICRLVAGRRGPFDSGLLDCQHTLALCYRKAGRPAAAVPILERLRDAYAAAEGPDGRLALLMAASLGNAYAEEGRPVDAVEQLRTILPRVREKYGPKSVIVWESLHNLAQSYEQLDLHAEAEPLRRERAEVMRAVAGPRGTAYGVELALLVMNLLRQRKWAAAETTARECLAIREAAEPDAWTTFNTQSLLGGALLGQKKYAAAEPLLLKGYEGMKAREKAIPPQGGTRIPEALDRLIELYSATGRPDEANKWRAERAKYPNVAPPPREKK